MSRSAKVKTVSRCMAARSLGIPATTTRSAAPCVNSADATWVIACREVRSLIPISTTPLPTGMMSPPSNVAWPQSCSGSPHQTFDADEVGVVGVDRLVEQGLVVAGRPVERVHGDPAVEPAGGVAGVERVGQRRHQVLAAAERLTGQGDVRRAEVLGQVVGGQPADQVLGQLPVLETRQVLAGGVDQAEADLVGDDLAVQEPVPGAGHGQRLGEHVVQLHDLHTAVDRAC